MKRTSPGRSPCPASAGRSPSSGRQDFVTTAEAGDQAKPDPKNRGPGSVRVSWFWRHRPAKDTVSLESYCLNLSSGEVSWEKTAREGRPRSTFTPTTPTPPKRPSPTASGDRLLRHDRRLLLRPRRQAALEQRPRRLSHAVRLGHRQLARAARATCVYHPVRQRRGIVPRRPRQDDRRRGAGASSATRNPTGPRPIVWKNKHRTELVTAGGDEMRSYDPATGKLLWEMDGAAAAPPHARRRRGAALRRLVRPPHRRQRRVGAIRPGAAGDISLDANETTNEHVAWSAQAHGYRVASPLLYQDCLYVLDNRGGILRCLDAKTGKEHYRKRLPGAPASPRRRGPPTATSIASTNGGQHVRRRSRPEAESRRHQQARRNVLGLPRRRRRPVAAARHRPAVLHQAVILPLNPES